MASILSPKDQVAQAMLLLHSKSPAIALNALRVMSEAAANVMDNDPGATDDDVHAATQTAIQNLGYNTDLDCISRQYDYLVNHHAGYWSGNYTIVDSHGGVHSLLINETDTRLLLNGTDVVMKVPSEGGGFTGKKLTVDNDQVALVFNFSTSTDGVDLTTANTDLADLAKRHKVQVSGSLQVKADAIGVRSIQGVRGVSTPAGVYHEFGEEPAFIWAGEYRVRYTDTPLWDFYDGALKMTCDPKTHAMSVQLGLLHATQVVYTNGSVFCRIELTPGVSTQVTIEMHATSGGMRMCYLWFETTGQIRTLTGYAGDALDSATLWKGAPKPKQATALKQGPGAKAYVGKSVENFFLTTFDATFSVSSLAPASTDTTAKKAEDLFKAGGKGVETIQVFKSKGVDGKTITEPATGFLAQELDASGVPTDSGRIALFTFAAGNDASTSATVNGNKFPSGAKLKAYQQLDEGNHWQFGLANTLVGVLAPDEFELPELVETESYEVRLSLLDYAKVHADGLKIEFAIDDTAQKTLIVLDQPRAYDSKKDAFNWRAYTGPSAETVEAVPDFTKASALIRASAGETQVTGHKTYYFSVRPKTSDGFFKVTKTIYRPSVDDRDIYERVGSATTMAVPILLRFPLEMTSVSEIQLTNTVWIAGVRGKSYPARVQVLQGGKQPFIWGLVNDGALETFTPPGLSWDKNGAEVSMPGVDIVGDGKMVSFGLSGTIASNADPGTVYSPAIRVRSDPSVVMNVTKANPQIQITEPETQYKLGIEVTNAILPALLSLAAVAIGAITLHFYKKETKAVVKSLENPTAAVVDIGNSAVADAKTDLGKLDDDSNIELKDIKLKDKCTVMEKILANHVNSCKKNLITISNRIRELEDIDAPTKADMEEFRELKDLEQRINEEVKHIESKGNENDTSQDRYKEKDKIIVEKL